VALQKSSFRSRVTWPPVRNGAQQRAAAGHHGGGPAGFFDPDGTKTVRHGEPERGVAAG